MAAPSITLVQVPCLTDNTAWLVVVDGARGKRAFVVDPSEAEPVLAKVAALGVQLDAIVTTHHHFDHVGGNEGIVDALGCAVIGNADDAERIPRLSRPVHVGERVDVCGLALRVLDVKAHTRAHVAYALDEAVDVVVRHGHDGVDEPRPELSGRPALFVGDTLFAAGCGRLFEGTPEQLERALRTLSREDERALVCCAHEYTAANLRFARHALPAVDAIAARADALDAHMGKSRSSLPSTLDVELRTNPFLLALQQQSPVEAVGALRRAKDEFRA